MKIGDRVKILTPYAKIILGATTGTVVKVYTPTRVCVEVDEKKCRLVYTTDLIKKIKK